MANQGNQYSVALPIQSKSLAFAKSVSQRNELPEIARRVFQNAIAVATVHSFFEIVGIVSNYKESDLWNPALQIAADSSDLTVIHTGQLECRWMAAETDSISVPYESWGDRIGYVFVSANIQTLEATIQGFLPTVTTENIPRATLKSVEFMLQHLDALTKTNTPSSSSYLTRWLAENFEPAWETVDSLLGSELLMEGAFRGDTVSSIERTINADLPHGGLARRAKALKWQGPGNPVNEPEPEPIILVVEIIQEAPLLTRVMIQMHPANPSTYLPTDIKCSILDQSQKSIIQTTSRSIDNYLQFPFKGEPGESFQVKLVLGSYLIIENFQI